MENNKADKSGRKSESSGRFNFMGVSMYFAMASMVIVAGALIYIAVDGFTYGVDFAGGTEVQVQFQQQVEPGQVRTFTDGLGYKNASVQAFDGGQEYLIRIDAIQGKDDKETTELMNSVIKKINDGLTADFSSQGATVRRIDVVGPQVGNELKRNGVLAAFYCLLLILIYVGLRFDYKFAPAAVFCLFHDAIVTLGIFAIVDREVSVQTTAAVLTLIGYSLNDTIVIFDRVRENLPLFRDQSLTWIFNRSINDTLSRTLLTNAVTILSVGSLYFFADGVIKDFAFTIFIGMILGTYSTVYVASPLVILFDKVQGKAV